MNEHGELISREELEAMNRELAEKTVILDHFVKAYSSAYTVNLAEDSFEILHMNHAFRQIFTMNGNRADMDRFIREHVHPDDRENIFKMVDRHYIRKRLETESEINFTIREQYDGNERTMHALIMRGADADHAIVGFMDITAEIQHQRETSERLEAANRAKSSFLFNMSHEMRTPLNAIAGYTALIRKYSAEPRVSEFLDKIDFCAGQLLTHINQVLEMSRMETGGIALRLLTMDIRRELRGIETVSAEAAREKDLHFEMHIEDLSHGRVIADEGRISQVIGKLIDNAVEYTPKGGTVTLTVREEPSEKADTAVYEIIVEDTGRGISPEFLPHIFDAFARENTSTVSGIQGTGLGLSIVRGLVDLMDGTIDISSEKGRGTKVRVRLPLRIDTAQTRAVETSDNLYALKGMKILLVEDNEMNREIAEEILTDQGVLVDTAEDGDIAVEKIRASKPGDYDLVLMDIQMPRMNGYDATRAIRALDDPALAAIPIVDLTANALDEDRQAAFDAGMNGHLAKPIDMSRFFKTLSGYRQ